MSKALAPSIAAGTETRMNGTAKVFLGYVVAVITATAATVSVLSTGEPAGLGAFLSLMLFGGAYVATCGLPGFSVSARRKYWSAAAVSPISTLHLPALISATSGVR